ncbi:MAG: CRISPR-associated endonuclease Cas1 [Candidatus Hatepunaea meridiana]|nr:CRISPR-associated endonuclease Cas1 [Candidatus Hatepunaea meridiana]
MLDISTYRLKLIRVSFTAKSRIHFNNYPGFTLHSMLGKALRSVEHGSESNAAECCLRRTECAYCSVFRAGQGGVRSPYTLSDIPLITDFKPGEEFSFSLTLFGDSVDYLNGFLKAFEKMEECGLGYRSARGYNKGAGLIKLNRLENLYFESYPFDHQPDQLDRLFNTASFADADSLTIQPHTPLRISDRDRKNVMLDETTLTPLLLIRNLVSRINGLSRSHNFGPVIDSETQTALENARVHFQWLPDIKETELDFYRRQQRGNIIALDNGVSRSFRIKRGAGSNPANQNEIISLAPLLFLGGFVHLGTPAAFGLGQYRLSFEDILPNKQRLADSWRKIKRRTIAEQNFTSPDKTENKLTRSFGTLSRRIREGSYTPDPLLYHRLPSGRKISIATLKDKVAQRGVVDGMQTLCEPLFSNRCYGFRPGKGTIKAVRRIRHEIHQNKMVWAATADINNFFDTIRMRVLISKLCNLPLPRQIIETIWMWLSMGGFGYRLSWRDPSGGIPQGGVISPLLSNIYFNDFDHFLERQHGCRTPKDSTHIRYCDDILFMAKSRKELISISENAVHYLRRNLMLKFNYKPKPVDLKRGSVEFLGLTLSAQSVGIPPKKRAKMVNDLNEILQNCSTDEYEKVYEAVSTRINRWGNYYGRALDKAWDDVLAQMLDEVEAGFRESTEARRNMVLSLLNRLRRQLDIKQDKIKSKRQEPSDSVDPAKRLRRRKREAISVAQTQANLILDTPGLYLGKRRSRLVVMKDDKIKESFAVKKIRQIFVTSKGIGLSSNVIQLLSQHKIQVAFMDLTGRPYSYIVPQFRVKQDLISTQAEMTSERRYNFAAVILRAKIANQQRLLKYWLKSRSGRLADELRTGIETIGKVLLRLETAVRHPRLTDSSFLLGCEAQAAVHYWRCFGEVVRDYDFPGRKHQDAKDVINMCLNYGYGFLYARAQMSLHKAGLSPFFGFLHRSDRGAPVLVYDFVEQFRQPMVDREIAAIANRGRELEISQGKLTDKTRKRMIAHLIKAFSKPEDYKNRLLTRDQIIETKARELTKSVIDESVKFKGYLLIHW